MNFQIKHRFNDSIIHEGEAESLRLLILSAVGARKALSYSNLKGANLKGANLEGANLEAIRDDFFAVLSSVPSEVAGLRAAIVAGQIDGSTYVGACACLVGTLAKVRKCGYDEIPGLSPQGNRPIERFFLGIAVGQTPENHVVSKIVLEWLDGWVARMQAAFRQKVTETP